MHRATDAVLTGIDRLARGHKNILLIATTNFPKAIDMALVSRADHVEEIGLPSEGAPRRRPPSDRHGQIWQGSVLPCPIR